MGFVRKNFGIDLTGGGVEDAARESARIQEQFGERALEFGAEQIGPFRDLGIESGGLLEGARFQGFDADPGRILNNPLFQALAKQQDQDLINQQAALGRGGSGETSDLLTRNLLLLGNRFQQQDFDRQFQESQLQFGQLFDQTRLGANAASQLATSGQNIITDIGSAKSGVPIVAGDVALAQGQQFLNTFGPNLEAGRDLFTSAIGLPGA